MILALFKQKLVKEYPTIKTMTKENKIEKKSVTASSRTLRKNANIKTNISANYYTHTHTQPRK